MLAVTAAQDTVEGHYVGGAGAGVLAVDERVMDMLVCWATGVRGSVGDKDYKQAAAAGGGVADWRDGGMLVRVTTEDQSAGGEALGGVMCVEMRAGDELGARPITMCDAEKGRSSCKISVVGGATGCTPKRESDEVALVRGGQYACIMCVMQSGDQHRTGTWGMGVMDRHSAARMSSVLVEEWSTWIDGMKQGTQVKATWQGSMLRMGGRRNTGATIDVRGLVLGLLVVLTALIKVRTRALMQPAISVVVTVLLASMLWGPSMRKVWSVSTAVRDGREEQYAWTAMGMLAICVALLWMKHASTALTILLVVGVLGGGMGVVSVVWVWARKRRVGAPLVHMVTNISCHLKEDGALLSGVTATL